MENVLARSTHLLVTVVALLTMVVYMLTVTQTSLMALKVILIPKNTKKGTILGMDTKKETILTKMASKKRSLGNLKDNLDPNVYQAPQR